MAPVRVRSTRADRAMQVHACLATVMDPELDESVTDLGFITGVEFSDESDSEGEVHIGFRLPTYWCAANFAFLMADDMRRAVQTLPWVTRVKVQLHDHMYAEAINQGVTDGAGFQAAFGVAAEGGLEALRHTFELKAFQRRQEALLQHLIDGKHLPDTLVALDVDTLQRLPLNADGKKLIARYLERRALVRGAPLAFVDIDGQPIVAETLSGHLRGLRRVGVNAEFNGALCRGLLAVRDQELIEKPIHFMPYRPAAATHSMN